MRRLKSAWPIGCRAKSVRALSRLLHVVHATSLSAIVSPTSPRGEDALQNPFRENQNVTHRSTSSSLATLALAVAFSASPAHALRAVPWPSQPPQPPVDVVTHVRTQLDGLAPDVQSCAAQYQDTRRALQVNVFVFTSGEWSTTFGRAGATPVPGARGATPVEQCISNALQGRLGPSLSASTGRTRKVSHRYTLPATTTPVGPVAPSAPTAPNAAQTRVLRRELQRHAAELSTCTLGVSTPTQIQYETTMDGHLRVLGIDVVNTVDFATTAACIERVTETIDGLPQGVVLRGTTALPSR